MRLLPSNPIAQAPDQAAVAPPKQVCYFAARNPAADDKIHKILASPLSSEGFEFTETPLEEVVNLIREEFNLEIQLDDAALDDLGIDSSEPVTVSLRNIQLGDALELMLSRLELTGIVSNGVLLITTEEEAETNLVAAVYPVADLMARTEPRPNGGSSGGPYVRLIDLIQSTVEPETWAENGGGAAEIRAVSPGLLVIYQTHRTHEEIRLLLSTIRIAKEANPEHFDPSADPSVTPVQNGGGGGGAHDGNPKADEKKS